MATPAEMMAKAMHKGDWSYRRLEDAINRKVCFKTIARYAKGESVINPEHALAIATPLWHSLTDRQKFIQSCQRTHADSDKLLNRAQEIKKAYTQVKGRYGAFANWKGSYDCSMIGGERGLIGQIKITPRDLKACVRIYRKRYPDETLIEITPDVGMLFYGEDEEGDVCLREIKAMEAYHSYCRTRDIHPYGLLELARRSLDEPGTFDDLEIELGSTRLMDAGEGEAILHALEHAERIIRLKNATPKEKNDALYEILLTARMVRRDPEHEERLQEAKQEITRVIDRLMQKVG